MLFDLGLHRCGSWSPGQGSGLKLHMNLWMQMESRGLFAGTGSCLHEGVALTQMLSVFREFLL